MSKITDRNAFRESIYTSDISVPVAKLLVIMKRKKRFTLIHDVRFQSMVSCPCIVSGYVEKVARKERKEDVRFLIISSRICLTVTHLSSF